MGSAVRRLARSAATAVSVAAAAALGHRVRRHGRHGDRHRGADAHQRVRRHGGLERLRPRDRAVRARRLNTFTKAPHCENIRDVGKYDVTVVGEIAVEYDHSDITAQLGARAIMDVLGTVVEEGHLGTRPTRQQREETEDASTSSASQRKPDTV